VKADESAFLAQVESHQAIIHKVCRLYRTTSADRSDLFQEILLQLWRAWPRFRGDSKVSTWMYRVALNTAISDLRKRTRQPETEALPPPEFLPETEQPSLEEREKSQFLQAAIRQLSPVEKAIVMLYLESHTYEEIAGMIGITPSHVGVKLNRIKAQLKTIIKPHFS
jgi:RNA polymerase sigma-70 factor (ECF subfamily)